MTENNETNAHVTGTNGSPCGRRFNWRIFGLLTAGIVVGLVGLAVFRILTDTPPKPPERDGTKDSAANDQDGETADKEKPIDIEAVRREAWQRIEPRLQTADKKTWELTNRLIGSIESFFDERREGTKTFAEAALSWGSKWELIKSREGHRDFLAQRFAEHVFTPEDLASLLKSAAAEYEKGLQAVENDLLVQARKDCKDLPAVALPSFKDESVLRKRFDEIYRDIAAGVARELRMDIGQAVGGLVVDGIVAAVVTKAITTIGVRMGVSGAILGTGAGASWATFGAGIVIAIVADVLLDWVIRWFHDPVEDISQKVAQSLDDVKRSIIAGDPEAWKAFDRLGEMEQHDPIPELRIKAAAARAAIEQGGALGLRHAMTRVAGFSDRVRRETLKQTIDGVDR